MLSRLRDGELALTPARTSVLLQMVDTVRALLTSIEACGGEGAVEVSGVVASITAAMDDAPAAAAPVIPAPRADTPARAAVKAPAATAKAPAAVVGLINLRGQVVTAIELRERLGRPPRPQGTDAVVIVVRLHGEAVS